MNLITARVLKFEFALSACSIQVEHPALTYICACTNLCFVVASLPPQGSSKSFTAIEWDYIVLLTGN